MKNSCINGYLKTKTRLLVTHQVHHLQTADKIFVVKNGYLEAQGTYQQLLQSHLLELSSMESSESKEVEEEEVDIESKKKEVKKNETVTNDLLARQAV